MVSVAVDEEGQSVPVPELEIEAEAGKRLHDEALNAER
jgi:acyl-CoA hydrolase